MSSPGQPGSWLCRTDADRERVVDMERRIKPTRTLTFALIAAALVFAGPWQGWWTLIPLTAAAACFTLADRLVDRIPKPEYVMAAPGLSSVAIAVSVALTGGTHQPGGSLAGDPRGHARAPASTAAASPRASASSSCCCSRRRSGSTPEAVADRPALLILPRACSWPRTLLTSRSCPPTASTAASRSSTA